MLQFGDHGGAVGYLVGEENRGLEYMFIMMNAARFAVGMQGIGDRRARLPAGGRVRAERVQSRAGRRLGGGSVADHPPPRRAPHADDDARADRSDARALAYVAAAASTSRTAIPDAAARKREPGVLRIPGADRQGLVAPR